jgi:hypothetical protein
MTDFRFLYWDDPGDMKTDGLKDWQKEIIKRELGDEVESLFTDVSHSGFHSPCVQHDLQQQEDEESDN